MAVTLGEIAKLAGVSVATVSYVLNGRARQYGISQATADRVDRVAQEHGYVPNRTAVYLKKGRYHLLTLIAPHFMDFFSPLVHAIEQEADKHDYHVLFCSTFNEVEREARYLRGFISRRVDGVVIMPTQITAKHLHYLARNHVPAILFRHRGDSDLPHKFMSFDDIQGACLATRHLLERGRRRVVFCSMRDYAQYDYVRPIHETRVMGFRKALEEAGLPFTDESVVFADLRNDDETALIALLKQHQVDGVVGIADEVVLPVMRSARLAGIRVPDDIAFIGFDDSLSSRFCEPRLSTLVAPRWEMGVAMVQALMRMIESGSQETDEVLYPFGLAARESTGGGALSGPVP